MKSLQHPVLIQNPCGPTPPPAPAPHIHPKHNAGCRFRCVQTWIPFWLLKKSWGVVKGLAGWGQRDVGKEDLGVGTSKVAQHLVTHKPQIKSSGIYTSHNDALTWNNSCSQEPETLKPLSTQSPEPSHPRITLEL